jgi:hypothetical protein
LRKITDQERVDQIFTQLPEYEAQRLLERAMLIMRIRQGPVAPPAKRGRKPKDKPTQSRDADRLAQGIEDAAAGRIKRMTDVDPSI